VERFSIGFPPNIISKKIGETEYCIGAILFGGYVKMKGDVPEFGNDDTEPAGKSDEFLSAPIWKRATVAAAGPFMNLVTAMVLFMIMIWAWGNPEPKPNSTEIGSVGPDTPAQHAGLKEGDRILAIDGHFFTDFEQMAAYIKERPDQNLVFEYRHNEEDQFLTLKTMKYDFKDTLGVNRIEGRIGIDPVFNFYPTSFMEGIVGGARATIFSVDITLNFLWKLVTRQVSVKELGGPIMIADQAGKAARRGLAYLFNLAAFLSINLGILNILPIPVLDGGQLMFLGVEAIRHKPIPFRKRLFWQQVGMGLLLLLMVLVTYNDIARLIVGGQ
jgi:regulator of sigma E protease